MVGGPAPVKAALTEDNPDRTPPSLERFSLGSVSCSVVSDSLGHPWTVAH